MTGWNASTGVYAKQIIPDIEILSNNTSASISISVIGYANSRGRADDWSLVEVNKW